MDKIFKIIKKYILTLFILFQCSLCLAQQDVDLLWKARALKATKNIKTLEKEMGNGDSLKLRLKYMLEFAYAAIVTMQDITVKKTPDIIAYHIVVNYGDDGILDVAYTYDTSTYGYLGVRIDMIPKNKSAILFNQNDDLFVFGNTTDTNEPMIAFSKSNPFGATVVDLNILP